ncbi:putative Small RNA 2'-O-methyltransferase [Hypsibius exemplaris]|uniref:Small RNA 2'-O-methyltransferase n=1 Tax=Hypsibius exemplaris TaxID=2072580 RepID=A0A1W0WL81_HYPEX|nr:putative Small RNA 2'-O-methyltransferase [Hypsibius exemplaris]
MRPHQEDAATGDSSSEHYEESIPFNDGADEPYPDALEEEQPEWDDDIPAVVNLDDDDFGDEEEPLFTPPLYIQRYCAVERLIEACATSTELTSLMDLGCAELKFLVRAKNGKQFERIVGVDCDEFLVGSHCRRLLPHVFEMVNKRERPLKMEVFAGDATQPDKRLLNIDVVTAIELIEHMNVETHVALAETVFGVVQPKLAVFTTPNVEYNPLFPGGSVEVRRHWDHRFEWTRAEFQTWTHAVVEKYPAYTVQLQGVGCQSPETIESHGYCSQIAVFTRNPDMPRVKRHITTPTYKLIREVDYPWAPPKTLAEELSAVMGGECYSLAKELQEEEENLHVYHHDWFTFKVEQLLASRWRLQHLLEATEETDRLGMLRVALKTSLCDWIKFDEENDKVSYQILGPNDHGSEDESPNLDMEAEAAGHYPLGSEMADMLEELEDPAFDDDY